MDFQGDGLSIYKKVKRINLLITILPLQVLFIVCLLGGFSSEASAGIFKWIKNEAIPTVTGDRPIVIKPYVSISSDALQVRLGEDSAMLKVGGITLQTGKLRLRLLQAGCTYATGDIMRCAPDVINREVRRLIQDIASGKDIETQGGGVTNIGGVATTPGLRFEEGGMIERTLSPPPVSGGYDFSNPGMPSVSPSNSSSAFFNSLMINRGVDKDGDAFVEFIGRADFANAKDRIGGISCIFSTEGKVYLSDTNKQYRDVYGLVAIGSSAKIETNLDLVKIQLSMPWTELELPTTISPYSTIYAQCNLTLDSVTLYSSVWMPF
jgi:hypothetical protein